MYEKRSPFIAIVVLVAIVFSGVVLSTVIGIKASPPSNNQPPVHNHPAIHYLDGQPAITPHRDGTLLTISDVQQYASTHQFPGGRVISGTFPTIVILQLMTSQEASVQMRGEYIGLPDNAQVYYVVVKGPFAMTNILSATSPEGSQTFNEGEEAFGAFTGNLLVWGIHG
jgi:hypothetical protein